MSADPTDLCTVADVESFLSLTAGQDTVLLQKLITNASAFIDSYTNRNLISTAYTEYRNGQDTDRMMTKDWPITAIASVYIDDVAVPLSTANAKSGYVFDEKWVYLRGDYEFNRGVQNVKITYTAGYITANIPKELSQACVEIVATKYKRRLDLHISSKVLDGQQINFTMTDVPASTKETLNNYSRVYFA
jgi:uncharacterized phiE125 gp8 family phage protein